MHNIGLNVNVLALQPEIKLPITQEAPLLSPCVQWNHETEWPITQFGQEIKGFSNSNDTVIFSAEELSSMKDHKIDSRILFPATGYLDMLWKRYANLLDVEKESLAVTIRDFHLHHAVIIPDEGDLEFQVRISVSSGTFEINESDSLILNGQIERYNPIKNSFNKGETKTSVDNENSRFSLNKEDIYKELRVRGYDYGPNFQIIQSSSLNGHSGKLLWSKNWVVFLDSMLQVYALNSNDRSLKLPTRIRKITIDPAYLRKKNNEGKYTFLIFNSPN